MSTLNFLDGFGLHFRPFAVYYGVSSVKAKTRNTIHHKMIDECLEIGEFKSESSLIRIDHRFMVIAWFREVDMMVIWFLVILSVSIYMSCKLRTIIDNMVCPELCEHQNNLFSFSPQMTNYMQSNIKHME